MYILCKDREKLCAAACEHIFFVFGCSREYFMFFKEFAVASERYQCATASERKCATAS